ncbi:MAG: PD-(D/E)XK nuclease family protein, partial [Chloroflexota bacterium]|nr:PD-(D/E)XK nuclease family protein [Chloroflexota bacterium]
HRRSRESLQLGIYALAYEAQHGRVPDELALHFLESGLVGRSPASAKRLAKASEAVTTAAEGIRAGRFDADPSPTRCGYCPFREICPDAIR